MPKFQIIRLNVLLVVVCTLVFIAGLSQLASAMDASTRSERNKGDVAASSHDLIHGSHVEGHIAYLKAELGISPEQEALWTPVANAMRDDVRNLKEAQSRAELKGNPDNIIEYLENRVAFTNLRAKGEARFLAAFRSLYNGLSSQQKQAADDLLMPDRPE